MADVHTSEQRSRNMAAIKGTGTLPEKHIRKLLFAEVQNSNICPRVFLAQPSLLFEEIPIYQRRVLESKTYSKLTQR